jgi:PAS domain S-box-containing protein
MNNDCISNGVAHLDGSDHFAQFYESDDFLLDSLQDFISQGMNADDVCIVIATKVHTANLNERLQAHGTDVQAAMASGRYISLDAEVTLSSLLVDGAPDPGRFFEIVGNVISRASAGSNRVRIFGEMVALLWKDGDSAGAIRLEQLWNNLSKQHSFSLFCAYPMSCFDGEDLGEQLLQVCGQHAHVIPTESYTMLSNQGDRLRVIAGLQQKARSLAAQVAERNDVRDRLRASEISYHQLFEASSDGILIVEPDNHNITDVNASVVELTGLTREELIGRKPWEIGLFLDREAALSTFDELQKNQSIHYERLDLKIGNGQRRDVEIIGNTYSVNSRQVIQLNMRDISGRKAAEESSLHLAAIVETSNDAIISKTLDGIILSWNKGAERIFGYTAEEVIGKPILILIPPDRLDEEPEILKRLKRGELIDHFETVRVAKDGRAIDISLTISAVKNSKGEVIAASKIARDITETKRAANLLRERTLLAELTADVGMALTSESSLQDILQQCADAMVERLDVASARIWTLNEEVLVLELRASGGKYSGLDGKHGRTQPGRFKIERIARDRKAHLTNDVLKDPELSDQDWAERERMVAFAGYPLLIEGKLVGVIDVYSQQQLTPTIFQALGTVANGIALGIERKRVDEARRKLLASEKVARSEAEAASRSKDEFLSTLSHELRTPLTAMLGWARMLNTGRLDEETKRQALEAIERNASAQQQLIEDILDMSRVISGKMRLKVRPVDLDKIVEAAVDAILPTAAAKDIRVQRILDSAACTVSADPIRLQQVVWNLLSNAVKFTPKGGRIQIRLERVDSHVEIVVMDTGQGISADVLPFVFDRFRQADSSSTRAHAGLGLGLSIVRHLVELHGGNVEAESEGNGKGATFTVKLPIPAILLGSDYQSLEGRGHLTTAAVAPFTGSAELAGLHILAVDDDEDTRALVKIVLESCGARVTLAKSAEEGIVALRNERPDVILSDLGMPEEDGYSLLAKVRALPADRGGCTPAAALTAFARGEDRMKVLNSGFQIHISKPVEPTELVTIVANLAKLRVKD